MRSDSRLLLSHAVASSRRAVNDASDGAPRLPALPSPVALQLLDIPFVLPLKQLPERVDGLLPRWAYEVQYTLVGTDRTRYDVRVSGDPSLGLPFGQDADVLLALFKILESEPGQHDLATGAFRSPSYQMICRALGKVPTGRRFREIRDALTRLAGVRIYSRVVIDKTALAGRIAAGDGATPEVPTASTARRDVTHEMRWLLEYRVTERVEERRPVRRAAGDGGEASRTLTVSEPGGGEEDGDDGTERQSQMWIQHLAINPFWVAQAVSGWAGWIDVERHARLKSPTARRLYQICAATAARQVAAPWQFGEDALAAACLLTTSATKKPTKIRQQLDSAADELREAGLVSAAAWQGSRRGTKTFEVHPAPLLQFADLLRGIGLTDPPDFRVQYAVLRHFGVTPTKARALLVDHPAQVGEVLLRACHLEATDPGAIEKSWAGWIVHHVQAATSFRGEVGFQKWRTNALRALTAGTADAPTRSLPTATGHAAGASVAEPESAVARPDGAAARLRAHYALLLEDADTAQTWRAALDAVLPTVSPFELYGLEVAVPLGIVESDGGADALSVWVHPNDEVAANMLARAVPRIEQALEEIRGSSTRVRVDRRDWRISAPHHHDE
ncbi:hypothetical protein tb265_46680 [Gemmatimonadetes bacterium T265]|nr:hypothetical protein tb265_46680 [Gemmatimonadetes bacterium T265]